MTEDESWTLVDSATLSGTVPWRTFRWYKGQRHYSGIYWCATMRDHVIYESRLELSRLIFADFDRAVHRILAQPFLLKVKIDGKIRKHIPDYFLATDHGPVVVDVKPEHLLARPKVAFTFEWTRRLVEARGWRYEVWSEPRSPELENLRFLAGYRRPWLFDVALLDRVRAADVEGRTFGEAVCGVDDCDPAAARAAVLHLLWRGELETDLGTPLSDRHQLARPA
ncbi:MAG TPA: TnsA-like heteromeric transposase endonuclease subunit [Streptosporangiaceae bacterium]|nr:TnsA-like heteromeric transposase endonuclease subunit [Streptosporangiaceae bacterium]